MLSIYAAVQLRCYRIRTRIAPKLLIPGISFRLWGYTVMMSSEPVFQHQILDRDPSLEQIPLGRYGIVVDGVNLPITTTEDVKGFSLCPRYSAKQLRRIVQIAKNNTDRKNRCSTSSKFNNKNFPRQSVIRSTMVTTCEVTREEEIG